MSAFWRIIMTLLAAPKLYAATHTDSHVKNLTLVGVIHVHSPKAKNQSVAVVRDNASGKTRALHQGDSIPDAALEVRELGPQHIVLMRGQQSFILRVDRAAQAAEVAVEGSEENVFVELNATDQEENPSPLPELAASEYPSPQRYEPKVLAEPTCGSQSCERNFEHANESSD